MRTYLPGTTRTVVAAWLSVFAVGLTGWGATGCRRHVTPAPEAEAEAASLQVVERFVAAFNRADPEGMAALAHPDIEWLSIEGAGIAVEARGQDALREAMTGYFASVRKPRSSVEGALANGPWVTVQERMSWEARDGTGRSQVALAVYQLEAERVRRVYYFPSSPGGP